MSASNALLPSDLMDAAFDVLRRLPLFALEHEAAARAALAERVPEASSAHVSAALHSARHLHVDLLDAAEAVRASRLTYDEAVAGLATRHPGFSADTYRAALGHGLFVLR